MLRHGQCFDPSTNLHASDFYTILGYIRSGHPLYKVRKKAGIRKEQSLHFSEQIDPFSGCHNLSSPYVKAAHVVHFSGLQIRGFFCITSPKHQGGSKNRHQPQNKNCRVFGRMFANISPLVGMPSLTEHWFQTRKRSSWHPRLVNVGNAPPLLCNGSNKRVAHSTLPTNDRTKDLILVARCLIFENW